MIKRYSKNVAGDFYVGEGCCITCAVPMTEAPEFFEMDDEQCYIVKQPSSSEEAETLLDAIQTQEAGCIRYAGRNRAIIQRMFSGGDGDSCDDPTSLIYVRTIARVICPMETPCNFIQAMVIAAQTHLKTEYWPRYTFGSIEAGINKALIKFGGNGEAIHGLEVTILGDNTFKIELEVVPGEGIYLAQMVDRLIRLVPGARDIWWMTETEWLNGLGQPKPY
jgi:ferredoxin